MMMESSGMKLPSNKMELMLDGTKLMLDGTKLSSNEMVIEWNNNECQTKWNCRPIVMSDGCG